MIKFKINKCAGVGLKNRKWGWWL